MWLPGGPQMNKFEQVSSDHHQMSLAGEGVPGLRSSCGWSIWIPCLMSRGQGVGPRSDVYGEGHCTVRSNASMVMITWDTPPMNRQSNTCKNITFSQLCWLKVISIHHLLMDSCKSTTRLIWGPNDIKLQGFSNVCAPNSYLRVNHV